MYRQIFFACIVTQAIGDNTWAYWQVNAEYLHLLAMHYKNNTESNYQYKEEILVTQLKNHATVAAKHQ